MKHAKVEKHLITHLLEGTSLSFLCVVDDSCLIEVLRSRLRSRSFSFLSPSPASSDAFLFLSDAVAVAAAAVDAVTVVELLPLDAEAVDDLVLPLSTFSVSRSLRPASLWTSESFFLSFPVSLEVDLAEVVFAANSFCSTFFSGTDGLVASSPFQFTDCFRRSEAKLFAINFRSPRPSSDASRAKTR